MTNNFTDSALSSSLPESTSFVKYSHYGRALNSHLRRLDILQKQIAKVLDVDPVYVSMQMSGKRSPPSKEEINKLCKYLQLSEQHTNDLQFQAIKSRKEFCFNIPENNDNLIKILHLLSENWLKLSNFPVLCGNLHEKMLEMMIFDPNNE